MKKLISIFVIVAVLATFLVPSAFAAEEPQLVVDSVSAVAGETITLNVSLVNNPGITNGKISVDYDEAGLEFVAFNFDETPRDFYTQENPATATMNFIAGKDYAKDGVFFSIELKVKDKAAGDYKVGLSIEMMVNNEEEEVAFEIVEGVVSTPIPDPAQLVVSSAEANNGEEVVLTVALVNNPGITNGKIAVDYDETGLEFVAFDFEETPRDFYTQDNPATATMNFIAGEDFAEDVVFFAIVLKVKDGVTGDFKVGLNIEMMVNNAEEEVVFEIVEGVVTVNHECVLEDVAEVPATCTEPGVKAHQKCACGKLYIDGTEVTEADLVIEALGHKPAEAVKENVVEATCTEDGQYDLVVYCSECGKELSRETIIVPAHHNYVDGECADCGEKDPDYVPETGDAIYVAVATALVSMMGIVALTKKKEF